MPWSPLKKTLVNLSILAALVTPQYTYADWQANGKFSDSSTVRCMNSRDSISKCRLIETVDTDYEIRISSNEDFVDLNILWKTAAHQTFRCIKRSLTIDLTLVDADFARAVRKASCSFEFSGDYFKFDASFNLRVPFEDETDQRHQIIRTKSSENCYHISLSREIDKSITQSVANGRCSIDRTSISRPMSRGGPSNCPANFKTLNDGSCLADPGAKSSSPPRPLGIGRSQTCTFDECVAND